MAKKRNHKTVHHILPKSRGWSNHSNNLTDLTCNRHSSFHTIFENMTINEQIREVILLSEPSLKRDFIERVFEILESKNIKDYYKPECFKY